MSEGSSGDVIASPSSSLSLLFVLPSVKNVFMDEREL